MVVGLRLWQLAAANVSSAAFQDALLNAVFTEMSEVAEVPRDQVSNVHTSLFARHFIGSTKHRTKLYKSPGTQEAAF
jgi:hypothetical protein